MISAPLIKHGRGALQELSEYLESDNPLVITSPGALSAVTGSIDLSGVQPRFVSEASWQCLEQMAGEIKKDDYSCCIVIGGGRNIDIAKLIWKAVINDETRELAKKRKAKIDASHCKPLIAVPTTCGSGSEASSVSVINIESKKVPVVDQALVPDMAILDPVAIESLSESRYLASLWDALAHGLESYVSPLANEVSRIWSANSIRLALECLEGGQGDGLAEKAMLAAFTAGVATSAASTGLAHAIAHTLEANSEENHSSLVAAAILPVIGFNEQKAPDKYLSLAHAVDFENFAALFSSLERLYKKGNFQRLELEKITEELVPLILRDPCARTNPTFVARSNWTEFIESDR